MVAVERSSLARFINRATRALSVLAGISLLFMMATITFGVMTRYLLNMPITGVDEIVQMTGVGLVMLALPYATLNDAHVRVDIFDEWLGRVGRNLGDVLSRLLSGFVLLILVSRAWDKLLDAREFEDTTNMLGLPLWPFYGMLAAGVALCALVFAIEILLILTGKAEK
ncbi:TRAP transporter small permease [Rhizobium sp. CSW-27]|uniref:TRAP transporter small permease n=1 Tax=Rhizobium sp. CSW-27 TaxID=2839985 RepID=UPI001C0258A8|nr:TRAP transporter small permease [Rhizobium sp. CSW-27]MBT9372975.1 TRAP transporter small permease [Rhizobium sp. CSW-27]